MFRLSDVPSETTIRSETYTDWESVFGVSIPHTVSLMVTPNVIVSIIARFQKNLRHLVCLFANYTHRQEQAGIQFGCLAESLLGVELENGGGGGTAGSHWEFRVMGVSIAVSGLLAGHCKFLTTGVCIDLVLDKIGSKVYCYKSGREALQPAKGLSMCMSPTL